MMKYLPLLCLYTLEFTSLGCAFYVIGNQIPNVAREDPMLYDISEDRPLVHQIGAVLDEISRQGYSSGGDNRGHTDGATYDGTELGLFKTRERRDGTSTNFPKQSLILKALMNKLISPLGSRSNRQPRYKLRIPIGENDLEGMGVNQSNDEVVMPSAMSTKVDDVISSLSSSQKRSREEFIRAMPPTYELCQMINLTCF